MLRLFSDDEYLICFCLINLSYVCRVPALTITNPLLLKTGLLKLNEMLDLQVCKLMQNNLSGLDVDYSSFTPVYSVQLHDTRFSRKLNYISERPRARLGQTSFRYLEPKFWSSVPDNLKTGYKSFSEMKK